MNEQPWEIDFWKGARGRAPVQEFLDTLDLRMRDKVLRNLHELEEQGTRLGLPLARPVTGQRFWELRVQMAGNIVRVFYFAVAGRRIILLHGFVKKDQKTPANELAIAARRLVEYLGRTT